MKKIEAIIRKSKFDEVKEALHKIEVNFFTYWDVTGVGNEKEGHVYQRNHLQHIRYTKKIHLYRSFRPIFRENR